MDFKKDPFNDLFVHLECPHCDEEIIVGLSDSIKKYGFVCPFCKDVTSANTMWDLILEMRTTGSSDDEA